MKQAINELALSAGLLIGVTVTAYTACSMFIHQVLVPFATRAMAAGGLPGAR